MEEFVFPCCFSTIHYPVQTFLPSEHCIEWVCKCENWRKRERCNTYTEIPRSSEAFNSNTRFWNPIQTFALTWPKWLRSFLFQEARRTINAVESCARTTFVAELNTTTKKKCNTVPILKTFRECTHNLYLRCNVCHFLGTMLFDPRTTSSLFLLLCLCSKHFMIFKFWGCAKPRTEVINFLAETDLRRHYHRSKQQQQQIDFVDY